MILACISLVALATSRVRDFGPVGLPGTGGIERWIVYPLTI